jgi:mRNA interferase MazF
MRKPGVTYDAFDVVIVPFPFTDQNVSRRRPALVLTPQEPYGARTGHCVIAMITAASASSWPFDQPISDPLAAGLASSG